MTGRFLPDDAPLRTFSVPLPARSEGPLGFELADGRIFAGGRAGGSAIVAALDAVTGARVWDRQFGRADAAVFVTSAATLAVMVQGRSPSQAGWAAARLFDAGDGRERGEIPLGERWIESLRPRFEGDRFFFSGCVALGDGGFAVTLLSNDRSLTEVFDRSGPRWTSEHEVAAALGSLVLLSPTFDSRQWIACDAESGKTLWRIERDRNANSGAAMDNLVAGEGMILQTGPRGLARLDAASGAVLWRFGGERPSTVATGWRADYVPVRAPHVVFAEQRTEQGAATLVVLDAATGEPLPGHFSEDEIVVAIDSTRALTRRRGETPRLACRPLANLAETIWSMPIDPSRDEWFANERGYFARSETRLDGWLWRSG